MSGGASARPVKGSPERWLWSRLRQESKELMHVLP